MDWLYLALAAAFEVLFATSMKLSQGFTRPVWSVATVLGVIGGMTALTLALKSIPISVAYPIWTAVGTLGTVLLGFALLGESLTPLKVVSVAAIVAGVAGLKIGSV